jgi:hypothetical protein
MCDPLLTTEQSISLNYTPQANLKLKPDLMQI